MTTRSLDHFLQGALLLDRVQRPMHFTQAEFDVYAAFLEGDQHVLGGVDRVCVLLVSDSALTGRSRLSHSPHTCLLFACLGVVGSLQATTSRFPPVS